MQDGAYSWKKSAVSRGKLWRLAENRAVEAGIEVFILTPRHYVCLAYKVLSSKVQGCNPRDLEILDRLTFLWGWMVVGMYVCTYA